MENHKGGQIDSPSCLRVKMMKKLDKSAIFADFNSFWDSLKIYGLHFTR